jgi:cytochrome P450
MKHPNTTQTLLTSAAVVAAALVVRRARTAARPSEHSELLPSFRLGDAARLLAGVLLPTVAKGVIIRRRGVLALAERLDLDRHAVRILQEMRQAYAPGPVLLGPIAGRRWAVVLQPQHVRRIVDETPEPFATRTAEKAAALSHFQPKSSLISHGTARDDRRRFNEAALDHPHPMHRLSDAFGKVATDEASQLLARVSGRGELTWDDFEEHWFRTVRRVVFGDSAADDHEISRLMARLRRRANWTWFARERADLREELFARIRSYIARAEAGSLAAVIASTPTTPVTAPEQQVPQWLFAFDPAGMAAYRALALIATHRGAWEQARDEATSSEAAAARELPFLRACVLESLRLWPTTPLLLRETTRETFWAHGTMPKGTGVIVFAPFFHRDDERLAFADRFVPEIWLRDAPDEQWPLVPFSLGSGACPGRNVVLLVTSTMLAAIIRARDVRLRSHPHLAGGGPLPGTLSHFSLRFDVSA